MTYCSEERIPRQLREYTALCAITTTRRINGFIQLFRKLPARVRRTRHCHRIIIHAVGKYNSVHLLVRKELFILQQARSIATSKIGRGKLRREKALRT